jgi:Tfp pilus assembly protein PilO
MKLSDRGIIFGIALAGLTIAFYLLVLGPKRDQASELGSQIDDLNASISQQQQVADFAEQARREFPRYYGRVVLLGKAVPARADTASMLVQLNSVADRSKIKLNSISLTGGGSSDGASSTTSATPPSTSSASPASPSSSTSTTGSTSSGSTSPSSSTAAAPTISSPAPATEASAASQPLGAVVGAAGLPTLPYSLGFQGTFFDVADFIGGIDGLVTPQDHGARVSSNGRLFTIDGFSLQGGAPGSSSKLDANFVVTTYVTPEDQGLTGGASPNGPAPTSPTGPQAQPASAAVAQ